MSKPNKPNKPISHAPTKSVVSQPEQKFAVQPEHTSLIAHQHIRKYMEEAQLTNFSEDDLTAVLRLSSHLRIFGLLSAVGYINQSNAQSGKVRERTVPVWSSLLGQLLSEQNTLDRNHLMQHVLEMVENQPHQYMLQWQRALSMANHWNFWARAYKEKKQ